MQVFVYILHKFGRHILFVYIQFCMYIVCIRVIVMRLFTSRKFAGNAPIAPADGKSSNEKREQISQDEGQDGLPGADLFGLSGNGNASTFSVYAAVRSIIFEAETKGWTTNTAPVGKKFHTGLGQSWYTCCLLCVSTCKMGGEVVNCRCHTQHRKGGTTVTSKMFDSDSDDSDETTQRELVLKMPQIVGAGLRSMFQLIAGSKHRHPDICTKALSALLDVIQGQQPESFRSEPSDLIDSMYDLLLELATCSEAGTESWSSVACSSLIGLCVARGDTGKMLKAIAALLMSPPLTFGQQIQLPVVLTTLQRSVVAVALNRPSKPDILHNGIPAQSEVGSFVLKNPLLAHIVTGLQPALATDGKYLFLLVGRVLFKIGSGFGATVKGEVYAVNEAFCKDVNGWLGYANVSRDNES